jgi:hypothetical protein
VALLVAGWVFADQVLCGVIRSGAAAWAWKRGEQLRIGRLDFDGAGSLRAADLEWTRGKGPHRSTFRCDSAILRPAALGDLLLPKPGRDRLWIRELRLEKPRLLIDTRAAEATGSLSHGVERKAPPAFPAALLPESLRSGPGEVVLIGETGRLAIRDLQLDLPSRWTGRISFRSAEAGLGAGQRTIPGGTTRAWWEAGCLRVGGLPLGEGLALGELTLRLLPDRLEFGLRGTIGRGLIRGDGSVGGENPLEVTLVGERLGIEALTGLIAPSPRASGTIDQVRLTFRGDPSRPMQADGSIRLAARNFRWDGRGWESLRLSASMTGCNLSLSELALRQGDNELEAVGRSSLPGDWHALLRAPFTADFRASLTDAGSLASLFGPEAALLGGSLFLDGSVRGADNRAEGYCNFSGLGTRFRRLPLDWVKGCLLFEGSTTRVASLEAAAGQDSMTLSGSVENSRPHAYRGEAAVTVKDLGRRLAELGLSSPEAIGAGALSGTWSGEGATASHRGEFRARFSEWVSGWAKAGLSGLAEGSYAPGRFTLTRAELHRDDLSLTLGLEATPAELALTDIIVSQADAKKPLASGEIRLPLDLTSFRPGSDPIRKLGMDRPLAVSLRTSGLRVEQLAELLGQPAPFKGSMEGWITASGTPAAPVPDCSLRVRGLETSASGGKGDLDITLRTTAGETACALRQEGGKSPQSAECTLPLRLVSRAGSLAPLESSPLRGSLNLKDFPLDGSPWIPCAGILHPLGDVTVSGDAAIGGTVGEPSVRGSLMIKARQASLSGPHRLEDIILPLGCSGTSVICEQGTGRYRGHPVSLSARAVWGGREASPKVTAGITGSNLPFEPVPGLRTTAIADLKYEATTSSTPILRGSLQLDAFRTDIRPRMVPVFCPPGFRTESTETPIPSGDSPRLDVSLTTADASNHEGPLLSVALRLTGTAGDPRPDGTVNAFRQTLLVPGATFDLPCATVTFGNGGTRLAGTAFGLFPSGPGVLLIGGSPDRPAVALDAPLPSADWILACTTPSGLSAVPILQAAWWLRQEMIFPVPAKPWSTRIPADADPGALGFYGAPWIWNLITPNPATSR